MANKFKKIQIKYNTTKWIIKARFKNTTENWFKWLKSKLSSRQIQFLILLLGRSGYQGIKQFH